MNKRHFFPALLLVYLLHILSMLSGIITTVTGDAILHITTLTAIGTIFSRHETQFIGNALKVIGVLTMIFSVLLFPYGVKLKKKNSDNNIDTTTT